MPYIPSIPNPLADQEFSWPIFNNSLMSAAEGMLQAGAPSPFPKGGWANALGAGLIGFSRGQKDAVQTALSQRLLQAQMQKLKREEDAAQARRAAMEGLSPEDRQAVELGGGDELFKARYRAPPETLADVAAKAAARARGTAEGTPPVTNARETHIQDVMKTFGVDRRVAVSTVDRIIETFPDAAYGGAITRNRLDGTIEYVPSTAIPTAGSKAAAPSSRTAGGGPGTLPEDVDFSQGTGLSGVLGWTANTVSDLAAGKLLAPETERAIKGLTNLNVRTKTLLQDAIPGRPSNMQMEMLANLAVEPANLLQGDARSRERLVQTRDMVKAEIERMDQDVLGRRGLFSREKIADTELSKSSLQSILKDYETAVASFDRAFGKGDVAKPGGLSSEERALIEKYRGPR